MISCAVFLTFSYRTSFIGKTSISNAFGSRGQLPDQGSQFGSDDFNPWCKESRLSPSMSRKGHCWDNAVAESFLSNLKSEKIKKKIYKIRQEAKSEVFEYIEDFYNPPRRNKNLEQLSPLEFERSQIALCVVSKIGGIPQLGRTGCTFQKVAFKCYKN
jgi:hypothetical protein